MADSPGAAALPRERKGRRDIDLDVLTDHLGYALRRAQVWVFQDFIRTLSAIDIRPAQYSVLVVIGANPGLSQAELADRLAIERARLVHMLDHLQQRGLTERLPSPSDRRTHALQLTKEGQRLLKRAKALAARHEARLTERIGAEARAQVLELLQGFVRAE
jgi:DNA-binding MarR family transcriptional regulator